MATIADRSKVLFSIIIHVDPIDIRSGSHDVADAAITDIEDPLDLTGGDQKLQFFRRVQRFFTGSGAQTAWSQHQIAEAVQTDNRRLKQQQEQTERSHNPKGGVPSLRWSARLFGSPRTM